MYGTNYGFQPQYQAQNYLPTQSDERIWVQNEQSAEAYLVAPNSFVRLWDATKPVFYEKRADATGRPLPIDVYEYSKKQPVSLAEQQKSDGGSIDWRKELDALNRRIEALEKEAKNEQSDADDSDV